MRGLVWSYFAYESGMFDDCGDPHERFVESSGTVEARRERVLYYGLRLAFVGPSLVAVSFRYFVSDIHLQETNHITFDSTAASFKASAGNATIGPSS